ncbi:MAG: PEP-CTERM sorting domain-containing protein, partial [Actinomycetota bacterium]|nr:PEP-CTERM sorting domain-containing protein [Actinomycetota bacterium]
NNKFNIVDTVNGKTYALAVDVTLEGYPREGLPNVFDQAVTVAHRPDDCAARPNDLACRDNMLKWFEDSTESIQAHEFGHMLGLYDEYVGGAVDKQNGATLSNDGLMGLGALDPDPVFYARYYQQYLDFIDTIPLVDYQRLGGVGLSPGQFVLVAVPEPSTWAMLAVGTLMLGFGVRRARRA